MKKSTQIVLLFLIAVLSTFVCAVGLRCSNAWRAERGLTFDAIVGRRSTDVDPRVRELDVALKRAKTERQKIQTVLVKRSQEAQESLTNLARMFKEFDESERDSVKNDFNFGKLSPQFENRADVAKAFVLYQEARALKKDEKSLRALYDRFDVAIARAESERANIVRQGETNELLGVKGERHENDQRLELIDRLTALANETAESNATENAVLLPSDVESVNDSDDELLREVVDASNSSEDVETFLKNAEEKTSFAPKERLEEVPSESNPVLDALKSIFTAVAWGGLTTLIVFAIGIFYLICPIRPASASVTSGNAPVPQNQSKRPAHIVRLIIFLALALYGFYIAGLSGLAGLGFPGLLNWRAPEFIREYGILRFVLAALISTFIVFLILVVLAVL